MKKTIKWLGIIALVAVIGFGVAGCPNDDDNGGNNNNNGGGTDYWAKFKNTDWSNATDWITFRESSQGKFMNFGHSSSSTASTYRTLTNVDANKFISDWSNGTTMDYVLSNDGKTLTLSNITASNGDTALKSYEGTYTKK